MSSKLIQKLEKYSEPYDKLVELVFSEAGKRRLKGKFPDANSSEELYGMIEEKCKYVSNKPQLEPVPEEILQEFFSHEDLFKISAKIGIPKEKRQNLAADELAQQICERIGFSYPPLPAGLLAYKKQLEEYKQKIEQSEEREYITGCGIQCFVILEKILLELIYFYVEWRFGDEEYESRYQWLPRRTYEGLERLTYGQLIRTISELDHKVSTDPSEQAKLRSDFNREYLILPESMPISNGTTTYIGIEDIDSIYEELKQAKEGRDPIVHYDRGVYIEAIVERRRRIVSAIELLFRFVSQLERNRIFPEVIRQSTAVLNRYRKQKIVFIDEEGEARAVYTNQQFDPDNEYYFVKCPGRQPIFIQRREPVGV